MFSKFFLKFFLSYDGKGFGKGDENFIISYLW